MFAPIFSLDTQSLVALEFWYSHSEEIPSLTRLECCFDTSAALELVMSQVGSGERWLTPFHEEKFSLWFGCLEIDFLHLGLTGADRWNYLYRRLTELNGSPGLKQISGLSHSASLVELDSDGNLLCYDQPL